MKKRKQNEYTHLDDQDLLGVIAEVIAVLKERGYDRGDLMDEVEGQWEVLVKDEESEDDEDEDEEGEKEGAEEE